MENFKENIIKVLNLNAEIAKYGSDGEYHNITVIDSENFETVADQIVNLYKISKRHCCDIDCDKTAVHTVRYSDKFDDYFEYCSEHLAENIPQDKEVKVSPIEY